MKHFNTLTLILIFVFFGCEKPLKDSKGNVNIKDNLKENTDTNINNNISKFEFSDKTISQESNNLQNDLLMIETQNGKRLNPETFKTVIPNSFMEYKGNVPSIGTLNFSGYSVTSLNNTYNGNRGFYKIVLQDYGEGIEFPEKKQFEVLPVISGMIVEKVKIENGKAYLIWDSGNNTGFLNALVYDRFLVKIDASNVLYKHESLIKFFDKIKLKYLREITLKDKIKK